MKNNVKQKSNLEMYKQFFTPDIYSNLLVKQASIKAPNKILDLTMGSGNLLSEAKKKWPQSELLGNDIDTSCVKNKELLEYCNFTMFNEDILKASCIQSISKYTGKIDLCLGNPPFGLTKITEEIMQILQRADFPTETISSTLIEIDIIFIIQCLEILKTGGQLIVILPNGFFVNNKMKVFRKYLLEKYTINRIIELPEKIFENTCAKTQILVLTKTHTKKHQILLCHNDTSNKITITIKKAICRMDYSYHATQATLNNAVKINAIDVSFLRGRPRHLLISIPPAQVIHTTNFKNNVNIFESEISENNIRLYYNGSIARQGDIVIPRVGKSKIGKIGLINKGAFIVTDCVFIIRPSSATIHQAIIDTLLSYKGRQWLFSIIKGVAAKHITLDDIKGLPIFKESRYENLEIYNSIHRLIELHY